MFITNKNNQLVKVDGSKLKTIYPDKTISIVFNTNESCIFVTDGMVCKYDTDDNFKILFHRQQKVTSIYETHCASNMTIIGYEDQAIILSPRVKIDNPIGRIEYYCEKFIIYKTDENFLAVSQNNILVLFPSNYYVRFIDRVTPVTKNKFNINIHVYGCTNGILEHRIYWTNGIDCKLIYTSSTYFNGIVHTNVCHRKSYYMIDNDSILHIFYENGGSKHVQLDEYRVVDKCIIDYKKPIKLYKLV